QPEAMEQPDPKHYNDFLQGAIQILDTLVLSIELPPAIVNAINRQTEQFYLIQEYRFRVAREAEESKRKQIEANGIAAFQQTVSKGISDSYLRWRGIQHDRQRFDERMDKLVDRMIDDDRLICDLLEIEPLGNRGHEFRGRAADRWTDFQDIGPLCHDDADADGRFAFLPDQKVWRICKTVRDGGDVAHSEHAAVGLHRRLGDSLRAVESAGHPSRHALRGGFQNAGRYNGILPGQRLE